MDKPMTVAEVVDAVAKGRIGHAEAMRRLHVDTYHDLVAVVHANGRLMWAHTPGKPDPKTMEILARAVRPELLKRKPPDV